MFGWANHKLESNRIINNLRYADDTTLMGESEEELSSLLMKVKEETEKADFNLNIQKTKTMASSPITARQTEEEKVEAVTVFIFLVSKITVDSDCSHEIRRGLLLVRKAMTKLDSVWWFWTVVLEKTLESPLDYKEIQPVHPKGNQPRIFIGRTDAEAETPILWPPDAKNRLMGKKPWCWERLKVEGEGDNREWDG